MEDFDNWFDILLDRLRKLGYYGTIDRDSAEEQFNEGITPEKAASILFKELTNDD